MFSKLSHLGILMDNMRELSLSIMTSSLFLPLLMADTVAIAFGLLIGGYYGHRIESQIHEFRSLGGRVKTGKSWDYLVLANPDAKL